jgi:hypothetical protein
MSDRKVVLLDLSKRGEDHVVALDDPDPVVVEVLHTGGLVLVLVRDDLRRSEWRKLQAWADATFGQAA